MRRLLFVPLVCLALVTSTGAGLASSYIFTSIDVPGSIYSSAAGINDRSQIVGVYADTNQQQHGFMLDNGTFTIIDVPNSLRTSANGINNDGEIVGDYTDLGGLGHGFLLSGGILTTIDVPGAVSTSANGINSLGRIVGTSFAAGRGNAPFVLAGGVFTTVVLPVPNTASFAAGINDRDEIVGTFEMNLQNHGFLLSGSDFTTIDVPAANTSALGINGQRDIVGEYRALSQPFVFRGFLRTGNELTPFDVPGSPRTRPNGINNQRHMVGAHTDAENVLHGFVATLLGSDTTPPVISGMPSAGCVLWPPNHRLVQVAVITATDAETGIAPGSFAIDVVSNEPVNPREPDVVITPGGDGALVVQLRAERVGGGKGRIYTLTATAADLAGNPVTSTATCRVPHDRR
jgi:probable HAF family extracellular repeat protein